MPYHRYNYQSRHRFHYVYTLTTPKHNHYYAGLTSNLRARLARHNAGCGSHHTAKYRPWIIDTATAFRCRRKAAAFEKYLKPHSGRAFASKHF